MTRQVLTEATPTTTATPVDGKPGRFLVQLISPGWGSSGYYSAEVLEAAGKAGVFGKGLHQYLDHPTTTEQYDRPERSVRDLAAVLEEDARWDAELQALVAEATVFGPYRQLLDPNQGGIGDAIGVSIRAAAEVQPGEAEGRHGSIITELVEGISADYVTHAGRGGKILQVIESARTTMADEAAEHRREALAQLAEARNIGQWVESRLHLSLTCIGDDMYGDGRLTREERIALSGAVGAALDAFTQTLEKAAPQLYQRDLWDDPGVIAAQVDEATRDVPATRPGSSTTTESTTQEEPTMGTIQVDEAEHRRLTEEAGRVSALESERDTAVQERDAAIAERDQLREADAGRARDAVIDRVLTAAVEAASVVLNEYERDGIRARAVINDGTVDEAATRTAFDTAVASIAEAHGAGRPRGLGGTVRAVEGNGDDFDAELDRLSESAFGSIDTVKEA